MRDFHPLTSFLFYVSVFVFVAVSRHPLMLLIALVFVFACGVLNNGKKQFKTFFAFFLPTILFVALLNGFLAHYGVTVLYKLANGNNICLEPFIYGLVTGVEVVVILMVFSNFNHDMTSESIQFLLSRVSRKISFILSVALRDIPELKKEIERKREALMTFETGEVNFIEKIKFNSEILKSVISSNLEMSIIRGDSMNARGFSLKNGNRYSKNKFTSRDKIFISAIVFDDIIIAVGLAMGYGKAVYNPYIFVESVTPMSAVMFLMFCFLCSLPLIYRICEEIKWKKLS